MARRYGLLVVAMITIRRRATLTGALLTSVVLALLLLAGSLLPGIASAATVTIGPALSPHWGVAESCPNKDTIPPVIYVDCAFVSTEDPTGVSGQAPADGTITKWRMAGFQGSAKLLVLEATGGGKFEIVQRSAEESEPCVDKSGICIPGETLYEFTTNLPIKKGQFIGVEGFSPEDCNESPQAETCTFFGFGGGASKVYRVTPADDAPATPDESNGGLLLNAQEETTTKTVAVSLSPAKITADGRAHTTATATVTEEGKPVKGADVSFGSSDPGESIGPVSETGDGTYTATITSSRTAGEATITATDDSEPDHPSGEATLTQEAPTIDVSVDPGKITADGKSTADLKATVTGVGGEAITGEDVSFASTDSDQKIGTVSEDGAGTYTATLTASETTGEATITATDDSYPSHPSADATLTQEAPTINVSVNPSKITADGKATATVKATVTGVEGEGISGEDVSLSTTDPGEKIGAVGETSAGTYSATITASHTVGTPTVTATDDSDPSHPSADATLTQGAPSIGVSVSPASITADGKSTATVKVTVKGVEGEPVAGEDIAVTTKGPVAEGLVKDEGNGTYTETLTALHSAGKVEVTATDLSVDPNVSASANLTSKPPKAKTRKKHKKGKKKKKKPTKKECKVPKLAGDTLKAAKKALSHANCALGKITTKKSSKIAKGKIISTNPKTGGKHKHGTRVSIILSSGKG